MDVRFSAAGALGNYAGQPGSEQAVAPLVGLLKDTEREVRSSAAGALGNYAGQPGSEQAVALLVGLLKDTERDVRSSAAGALGNYAGQPGGEQAVEALTGVLKDTDEYVPTSGVKSLASFAGLVEIKGINPILNNLRKKGGKEEGYWAMLSLALMDPDRTDLQLSENSTSASPTILNQLDNTLTVSRSRNANLLIEAFDSLEKVTQIAVLSELGRFPSPRILSKLMELEQQDDGNMREAALMALGKNGTPKALSRLQAVAEDPRELMSIRVQAIHTLGYNSSESVAEFLTKLMEQEPFLANPIYAALDRLASPKALPFLKRGLAQQEQRHQQWREFRNTWKENFDDEKHQDEKDAWVEELKALQPDVYLENWFARQIARLDLERAAELLRHNLYAIRRGAWLGIAQSGNAERVRWLIDQYADEENPLFRFALYRAIDRLLRRLEVVGNDEDLSTLKSLYKIWKPKLSEEQSPEREWTTQRWVQQTILNRIEWTIPVLESRLGASS